ncbi:MAG: ATP-binding protein [Chloroflexaceae bacterium]
MARGTVLIVEHKEELRRDLARIGRACGFDLLVVADGEEAAAAFNTTDIDIVLTDLCSSCLDGYSLIRWMHERGLNQPVVVIAGDSDSANPLEGAIQALRAGAYDYVAQPFDHATIEAALSRAEASVEHRRADGALRRRNRELAALNAISTAVSASLELDEILDRALGTMVEALELTSAIIYLGEVGSGFTRYRSYGTSTQVIAQMPDTLSGTPLSGVAIGAAQIVQILGDLEQMVWRSDEAPQALIVLTDQGMPCGLLLLIGPAAQPIQHDQLGLLQSIGNYLSVAIANVRLYSEVRDSARLLERLVTQRTQELQRSRDLLHTIFDGIPGGLLLVDSDERVLAVNRAYARLLDQEPEALIAQDYQQIWSAPWGQAAGRLVQRCIAGGQPIYQRDQIKRPRHSPIVLDHYLFPVRDATSGIIQVIEYLEDVTERLALERALTQNEQLMALGKLAATVAHEVNTPLLAIRGCLGLLANAQVDPTARAEYLAMAESELDRAAGIIRVMLDFYQSNGNEQRSTDVNVLIERVAQLLKGECTRRNIEVLLCLAPALPAIPVIPDRLKQVILNLTLNALEVLPDGGQLILRTSLREEPRHASGEQPAAASGETVSLVVIEVEDTGSGVPDLLHEQIFDAFVTTKSDGSGLGLAVCRTIVQEQGGTISVENVVESGARFTVTFPVVGDAATTEQHAHTANEASLLPDLRSSSI